jgi:endonuclease/exonuclease/phosphatase family metal-dependent hydrolase
MIYVNNFIECECRGESMLEIKVMTFNIHHGKGMDNRADLFRIAELIDKCDVDIVGLNEVDRHFSKRSLYEDQIGWLANQLDMDYAFSPSITIKSKHLSKIRQYGNALLSRYQKLRSAVRIQEILTMNPNIFRQPKSYSHKARKPALTNQR